MRVIGGLRYIIHVGCITYLWCVTGTTAFSEQLRQFVCEVSSAHVDVAVQINGFDCGTSVGTNRGFRGCMVNQFCRNGSNDVSIVVLSPGTNNNSRFSFTLRDRTVDASSGTTVADSALASVSSLSSMTSSLSFAIQGHSITTFPWTSVLSYEMTSGDVATITNQVMMLRDALARKDVGTVAHLLSAKTRHMAISYGMREDEMQVERDSFFGEFFSDAGYSVDSIDVAGLRVSKQSGGNYVSVEIGGSTPIRIHGSDDVSVAIPMNFAKLSSGGWAIMF